MSLTWKWSEMGLQTVFLFFVAALCAGTYLWLKIFKLKDFEPNPVDVQNFPYFDSQV